MLLVSICLLMGTLPAVSSLSKYDWLMSNEPEELQKMDEVTEWKKGEELEGLETRYDRFGRVFKIPFGRVNRELKSGAAEAQFESGSEEKSDEKKKSSSPKTMMTPKEGSKDGDVEKSGKKDEKEGGHGSGAATGFGSRKGAGGTPSDPASSKPKNTPAPKPRSDGKKGNTSPKAHKIRYGGLWASKIDKKPEVNEKKKPGLKDGEGNPKDTTISPNPKVKSVGEKEVKFSKPNKTKYGKHGERMENDKKKNTVSTGGKGGSYEGGAAEGFGSRKGASGTTSNPSTSPKPETTEPVPKSDGMTGNKSQNGGSRTSKIGVKPEVNEKKKVGSKDGEGMPNDTTITPNPKVKSVGEKRIESSTPNKIQYGKPQAPKSGGKTGMDKKKSTISTGGKGEVIFMEVNKETKYTDPSGDDTGSTDTSSIDSFQYDTTLGDVSPSADPSSFTAETGPIASSLPDKTLELRSEEDEVVYDEKGNKYDYVLEEWIAEPSLPDASSQPEGEEKEEEDKLQKIKRDAVIPSTVAPAPPTPEAEAEQPVVGYTPDSLISEELSCQEPRSIELDDCEETCEVILGNLDVVDGPTLDPRWLLFSIILGFFALACLIRRARKWLCGEAQQVESTPLPDQTAQAEANIPNAPDTGKNPAKKEDKSLEEPSPPSVKNNAAVNKMRAKLLETQANLQKLRLHVKKTTAQHKSDTRTSKFQKKGPIFIPREPPIPPAAILPDNIILEKVTYDPENNEEWDIGSDVDDIELDESFRLNPDSLTETEDEASRKSGSKKSKKSKKNDPKDKKTGGTDDPKNPKENETPAPAPTAPPAPTTAPAPEPPKTADAKEKKENKSVEQDKSKKN
ncbi:hypothetical protein CAEBREN_10711 [Caenorhabditis brenneri]|uniref:Uncharacterized protein n=1 Tax=Caenorhabditis brenneri TaxID=135651 RepID=G0MJU6_CAEBE|nr:hypothetical protein CAEBREN_10711 [Caenorhabditis brenneri]